MRIQGYCAVWCVLVACKDNSSTEDPSLTTGGTSTSGVWGQESLDYVTEHLNGTFEGEWALFGIDENDAVVDSWSWTDVLVGSDPRIEDDRALVDIISEMDGGSWSQSTEFQEGLYIEEDGSMGEYFIDMGDRIIISTEVETDLWMYEQPLGDNELSMMANVDETNLIDGWQQMTKLVSYPDGAERHDVTIVIHAEYDDGAEIQTVEFTYIEGYHQRVD